MGTYKIKIQDEGELIALQADDHDWSDDFLTFFRNDEPVSCFRQWTYWIKIEE